MTAREKVSHVDTAWLRMDRPENLLQIVGAPGLARALIDTARLATRAIEATSSGSWSEPLSEVSASVISVGGKLWGQYFALRKESAPIGDLARIGGAVAREIGKPALMAADSPTRFKGKPGTVKRVAWPS